MSSSEEEEIYKRRKKCTEVKEELEELFEEKVDESTEEVSQYSEEYVFVEIFGTGHEYDYIYETEKMIKTEYSESTKIKHEQISKYYQYENDIFIFLLRRSNYNESEKKCIKLMLQGYSIYYIFFHCELCFDMSMLYEMKKRIPEYIKIKSCTQANTNMGFYENIDEYQKTIRFYEKYKDEIHTFRLCFMGKCFLTTEELYENVVNNEETHICQQPENSIEEFVQKIYKKDNKITVDEFVNDLSLLYAKHPLFVKLVVQYGVDNVINQYKGKDELSNVRSQIMNEAIQKIDNLNTIMAIHENMIIKQEAKKSIANTVIDIILNGGRPISEFECVIGIFEYRHQFNIVIVNHNGKCLDYFTLNKIDSIMDKIENHKIAYIIYASMEKSLKYTVDKLQKIVDYDVVVIDNSITYRLYGLDDLRIYTINLVKRVIWPELEFCRSKSERIKVIMNEYYTLLTNNEYFEMIDHGVKVALCYIGVDVNKLHMSEFQALLNFIGLNDAFIVQINDLGEIPSLKVLKEMNVLSQRLEKENSILIEDPINDFDNSCVFLRCYNDIVLDSFMIHPKNYNYAKVLASAAFNEEANDDLNFVINKVIQNPVTITKFNMSAIAQTGNSEMINIRNYLLINKRNKFEGVTNEAIFYDLIGIIKNQKYEGKIKKIDRNYLIASVQLKDDDFIRKPNVKNNTLDVYVKTNTNGLYVNQYVYIEIIEPSISTLTYIGCIVENEREVKQRFVDNFWYKNFNCIEAENYLRDSNKLFLLRQSGRDRNTCIITAVISKNPNIFVHLKLLENNTNYEYNGRFYDDIDEFVSRFVKKMFVNIKRIKENKFYKRNKENAMASTLIHKYAFFLSQKYPGRVVFIYKNEGRFVEEYIKIEDKLIFEKRTYETLEHFLNHRIKA